MSNFNTVKHIVFDFGSVLRVRSNRRAEVDQELVRVLNAKLDEVGYNPDVRASDSKSLQRLAKGPEWRGVGYGEIERRAAYNVSFSELGIGDAKFQQEFVERLDFEERVVLKEMYALLRRLKQTPNVQLAILSNHSNELPEWLEKRYELMPQFFSRDKVLVSAEHGIKKPDPRFFEVLLETLAKTTNNDSSTEYGKQSWSNNRNYEIEVADISICNSGSMPRVEPQNILFIDNKELNCNAAKEYGIQTVLYKYSPEEHSGSLRRLRASIDDFLRRG